MKKIILIQLLCLSCLATAWAQKADSLYIFRFVQEKDVFYVPWRDNGGQLEQLVSLLQQYKEAITAGSIPLYINGYCTGQPTRRENLRMAATRSNHVKSELIRRAGLAEKYFITANHQGSYKEKRNVVTVTVRIPVDTREVAERDFSDTDDTDDTDLKTAQPQEPAAQQTVQQPKNDVQQPENDVQQPENDVQQPENTIQQEKESVSSVPSVSEKSPASPSRKRCIPLSLRANLLRWATLTPDLGIEWYATPHISILLNASWTSWRWKDKDRRYALWNISPEVRHYLGIARHGYLGLMYHTGEFNYKLTSTGRQGSYHGGGITGGYLWMFRPSWGIDFHLSAGYTRAEYDTYTLAPTGIRVYKEHNASRNYWGINSAAITLIWKIGGNKQ